MKIKLTKTKLIIGFIFAIVLAFFAGGNPTVQNVEHTLASPIAYASGEKWNLHKQITHKQFSYNDDIMTTSQLNKKASLKAQRYLRHVGNLNDYHYQISQTNNATDNAGHNRSTVNIYFIRK